jgi:hypothetical protein
MTQLPCEPHLSERCRCKGSSPAYVNGWTNCCALSCALWPLRGAVAALQTPWPRLQEGLQQRVLLHSWCWGPGGDATAITALFPRYHHVLR